jgi:zinc transport system substrate-binding protein
LETFVGIPPVAYLVERIGGPHVRAEVLVRAGQDPHTFEPTPRQVVRLSRAKLFFKIGMPFEEHLAEHIAAGPTPIRVVDTAAGIARRTGEPGCACAHGHAHEHEHEPELGDHEHEPEHGADGCSHEAAGDPHLWLSPPLLKRLAANVARALGEADPRHAAFFQANLALLAADLDALDRRIAARLAPCRGRAFYVFHPAFGYFADRYDLRQESVEIEGKPPTPRQLFGLVNKARNDGVKIVFLQSQFNQQVAASVAQAIGGTVASLDSLAYDVPANLDEVAEKIAAAGRDPHVSPCAADCGAEHACHEEDP